MALIELKILKNLVGYLSCTNLKKKLCNKHSPHICRQESLKDGGGDGSQSGQKQDETAHGGDTGSIVLEVEDQG